MDKLEIFFRAKSMYSNDYIISKDIKFEMEKLFLRKNNEWIECDELTRSINISNMVDNNNKPIFASLDRNGKGGDLLEKNNHSFHIFYNSFKGIFEGFEHVFKNLGKSKEFLFTRKIEYKEFFLCKIIGIAN